MESRGKTENTVNMEYDMVTSQEDIERAERRKLRMAEMKRVKKQQELMRGLFVPCAAIILAVCVASACIWMGRNQNHGVPKAAVNVAGCMAVGGAAGVFEANLAEIKGLVNRTVGGRSSEPPLDASPDGALSFGDDILSENGVFIDVTEKKILGQRDAMARISPASMTKILTVLVAAEHTVTLDDTFEITREITDYSFSNDCSSVGFDVGEKVTVRDLFYGTVLPSGADAALALAIYTAGSHEEFVRLMNEKLDGLGLSGTSHFTNCVGLYDDDHYSTVYDIGVILKAAYDNSFCREVLSAHTYTITGADMHPDGIDLSNLFLRRIEDRDTKGEVLCAKTGFVMQSGNCAASLEAGNDGKMYICVTAHASSAWQCIRDHVAIYQQFVGD